MQATIGSRYAVAPAIALSCVMCTSCGGGSGDQPGQEAPADSAKNTLPFAIVLIQGKQFQSGPRLFRNVTFNGASAHPEGADGVFFTGDDAIESYTEHVVDADPLVEKSIHVSSAGKDGLWFTADDQSLILTGLEKFTFSHEMVKKNEFGEIVSSVRYQSRGADKLYFTADDDVDFYEKRVVREGRVVDLDFTAPGADQKWFTDDDVFSNLSYTAIELDPTGRALKRSTKTSGTDAQLFTDDDETCTVTNFIYSDNGEKQEDVLTLPACGVGLEIAPNGERATRVFYADGSLKREITYAGPGADGAWLTADDVISGYTSWSEPGAAEQVVRSYSAPGPDNTWLTLDDITSTMTVMRFGATDRGEQETVLYKTAGIDNTWGTADDEIAAHSERRRQLLADGKPGYVSVGSDNAGADGIWRTADDIVTGKSIEFERNR